MHNFQKNGRPFITNFFTNFYLVLSSSRTSMPPTLQIYWAAFDPGHIRSGWSGDSVIWISDGTEGIGKEQVSFSDSWSGSTICETKGLTSKKKGSTKVSN